jgi:hypothetical protein
MGHPHFAFAMFICGALFGCNGSGDDPSSAESALAGDGAIRGGTGAPRKAAGGYRRCALASWLISASESC